MPPGSRVPLMTEKNPLVVEVYDGLLQGVVRLLEAALILHLEHFLRQLGTDFAFDARQKRRCV